MKRQPLIIALIAVAFLYIARAAFLSLGPRLLINSSPSAPAGVYLVSELPEIKRGELVAVELPNSIKSQYRDRSWFRADYLLIKRVAAIADDVVCWSGDRFTINGAEAGLLLKNDSTGTPLSHPEGCLMLSGSQFLPQSDLVQSFDGRYFGPLDFSAIKGRAELIVSF